MLLPIRDPSHKRTGPMEYLSRRRFLKISAATFGAAAAARALGSADARRASPPTPPQGGVATIPTFCEMCFWRCGGIAHVRDGKLWKFEGNPRDPQSRGRLCPRGTGAVGALLRPRSPAEAADPPRRARQGRVDGRHVGRGVHVHRREDAEDQGAARPRVGRDVQPRHRAVLHPARAEVAGARSTSPGRRSRSAAARATSASR